MPALPGAQYTASTIGEAEIAQARACARPPEPTTSTFIGPASLLLPPPPYRAPLPYVRPVPYIGPMNDQPLTAAAAWGAAPRSNLPEYSVSELSAALKRSIEDNFAQV